MLLREQIQTMRTNELLKLTRVESASRVIAQAIALYENLLEQQEKTHQQTNRSHEAEKAWICQKRQELEQVHNQLDAILTKCPVLAPSFAS